MTSTHTHIYVCMMRWLNKYCQGNVWISLIISPYKHYRIRLQHMAQTWILPDKLRLWIPRCSRFSCVHMSGGWGCYIHTYIYLYIHIFNIKKRKECMLNYIWYTYIYIQNSLKFIVFWVWIIWYWENHFVVVWYHELRYNTSRTWLFYDPLYIYIYKVIKLKKILQRLRFVLERKSSGDSDSDSDSVGAKGEKRRRSPFCLGSYKSTPDSSLLPIVSQSTGGITQKESQHSISREEFCCFLVSGIQSSTSCPVTPVPSLFIACSYRSSSVILSKRVWIVGTGGGVEMFWNGAESKDD